MRGAGGIKNEARVGEVVGSAVMGRFDRSTVGERARLGPSKGGGVRETERLRMGLFGLIAKTLSCGSGEEVKRLLPMIKGDRGGSTGNVDEDGGVIGVDVS